MHGASELLANRRDEGPQVERLGIAREEGTGRVVLRQPRDRGARVVVVQDRSFRQVRRYRKHAHREHEARQGRELSAGAAPVQHGQAEEDRLEARGR